jgi:hypothetical protein
LICAPLMCPIVYAANTIERPCANAGTIGPVFSLPAAHTDADPINTNTNVPINSAIYAFVLLNISSLSPEFVFE